MRNFHTLALITMMGSPIWRATLRSEGDHKVVRKGLDDGIFQKVVGSYAPVVVVHTDPRKDFSVELTDKGREVLREIKDSLVAVGLTDERGLMNLLVA